MVPEEFETSIEIFALVLRTYNMPQDFVMRKAEQVRREGYALLRRSELPELAHHLRGGTASEVQGRPRARPVFPALQPGCAHLRARSQIRHSASQRRAL